MVWLQAALAATVFAAPGETVMLDFYADWCGPCRAMQPTIDALIEEGCPVRKINVDRNPELARKYGVRPIPCYIMLVDGQEVDRVVGGTSFSRLKRMWAAGLARQPKQAPSPVPAQTPPGNDGPPIPVPGVEGGSPLGAAIRQPLETQARTRSQGSQASAPGWTPQRGAGGALDAALDATLIAASVRLRIEDADGHSCGSGTIVDARQGEALILTCGHIFRDSQGKGRIEVDLFGPEGLQQVAGNLISYDLQRDVGLVSIRTPGPVATARVAPRGHQIGVGNSVVSVGCDNGDRPTARRSHVSSLNKFVGPANLEVAGLPVEGRSGGGLFSGDGLVIGVCNAADPSDQEGLYAALASIHAELDKARLSFVYKSDDPESSTGPALTTEVVVVDPPPRLPKRMPDPSASVPPVELPARPAAGLSADTATLSIEERAALYEIGCRMREGAEVVCVVRSRRDPRAKSEVIVLDGASPDFLGQLAAMARPQDPLRSTSLEVPRNRQPEGAPLGREHSGSSSSVTPIPQRPPAGNQPGGTIGWRSRQPAPATGQ